MAKYTRAEIKAIITKAKKNIAENDVFLSEQRELDRADAKEILGKAATIIKLVAPLFGDGVSWLLKGVVWVIGRVK